MYTVKVEHRFKAGHCVRLPNGELEDAHHHEWHVWAEIGRSTLDNCGFVVDFHKVQRWLKQITQPLCEKPMINELSSFKDINPTAENISIYIYDQLLPLLYDGLKIISIEVHETPGCRAIYTNK